MHRDVLRLTKHNVSGKNNIGRSRLLVSFCNESQRECIRETYECDFSALNSVKMA